MSTEKSRIVHNTKNRFLFYSLVQTRYTDSKLNDVEFARMAQAQLGFACNSDHVRNARKDLDIATNAPQHAGNPNGFNGHHQARLLRIETWLNRNFAGWDKQ